MNGLKSGLNIYTETSLINPSPALKINTNTHIIVMITHILYCYEKYLATEIYYDL